MPARTPRFTPISRPAPATPPRGRLAIAAIVLLPAVPGAAQSVPLEGAEFFIDPETGAQELVSVTLTRGGVTETIGVDDLVNINVLEFVSAVPPLGGPALFGVPAPFDTPGPVPAGTTLAATPPPPGERAGVLEDFIINSAINNPGVGSGLVFEFINGGIVNGVGADVILFELSPPEGVAPAGDPTNPSVGGDPFQLAGVGDQAGLSATFGPEFLGDFGPVAPAAFFGSGSLAEASAQILSLEEFESIDVSPIIVTAPTSFELGAVAVDLSDLGFAEGALVSELELLSSDLLVLNEFGLPSGPFGFDAALIVGLPEVAPIPAPGPAALIGLAGLVSVRRRR